MRTRFHPFPQKYPVFAAAAVLSGTRKELKKDAAMSNENEGAGFLR
jgi:hypothetical protein